jgi:aerobic-type carbon monoxide dehydrogenase small subunit (CoxS/CutS family)
MMSVNGRALAIDIDTGETLLQVLRDRLGLTGTKEACGRGECGACTVLVGDKAIMSCITLASAVVGDVTTIEGLRETASDLAEAFADHYGFQCGFCTSGQIVRAEALLRSNQRLQRRDITAAMSGNICRCTGYVQIVAAVEQAATGRGLMNNQPGEADRALHR